MHVCRLSFGFDESHLTCASIEFDLEKTMDSIPEQGHRSNTDLSPIPLKRKKITDCGEGSHAAKEIPLPSDEPAKVASPLEPKEGNSSCTRYENESSLPNFGFPPTQGYHEMEIL